MIKTAFTRIFFLFQDPGVADVYTQHSCNAISAKYSPSGFYIASGGSFTIYPFIKFRDEIFNIILHIDQILEMLSTPQYSWNTANVGVC